MYWKLLMLVLKSVVMICCQRIATVVGAHVGDVYWNSSNSIFLIDNTNHVFSVRIDDYINLYCPKYENTTDISSAEVSLIYRVNQYGNDFCTINRNSEPVLLGFCNKPYSEQLITTKFRSYTPNPSGPEFQPYTTYFFISTSNGSFNGLANTDGGLCAHKNMRLRIEVLPRAPSILATTPKPWGFRPRPIDDSHQDTYDSDGLHPSDADNESGRRRSDSINSYEIVGDGKSAAKEMISWDRSEQSRYEFEGKRADQSSTKQFFIERQISDQSPVVINLSPAERRNGVEGHMSLPRGFVLSLLLLLYFSSVVSRHCC